MQHVATSIPRLLITRTRYTRWLAALLSPSVILIAPPIRPQWAVYLLEAFGLGCLAICVLGRIWTSLYVADRKDTHLMVLGPYSVVRNPLYMFSFIGIVGIGFVLQVITLLVIAIILFVPYYSMIVALEETQMSQLHGASFAEYVARVPRWLPNFSGWKDVAVLEVDPRFVLRCFLENSLFFPTFLLFVLLQLLRAAELLPTLLILP